MAIALTTVAFVVTGISAKINKAAASVFGEDLVKIGNIFGAGYMAFGGGFGGDTPGAESLNAVNGMDLASDQFTAAASGGAGDFGSLADMAGETMDTMSATANTGYYDGMNSSELAGIEDMARSSTLSPAVGVQDLLNGGGADLTPLEQAQAQAQGVTRVDLTQPATTAGQGAAGQNAAAQVAAAPQPNATVARAAGSNAAAPIQGQGPYSAADYRNASDIMSDSYVRPPVAGQNVFDRLGRMVTDEKGNVTRGAWGALQGVGQGIGSASAASTLAKQKREQYALELAEQQRRMNLRTGLRVTG